MRNGEQKIARAYVLYREERAAARAQSKIDAPDQVGEDDRVDLNVKLADGSIQPLDTRNACRPSSTKPAWVWKASALTRSTRKP